MLYNTDMSAQNSPISLPDQDWYRDVIEGGAELIDVVDPDGTILYTNTTFKLPGSKSLIGTSIYDYFFPEFHKLVREKITRVFETGEMDYYELATDYNTEDTHWFMTRLGPIIRDGKIAAVTLFIRDITNLKIVEQELNKVNYELEQRVEERTRELNQYAHRLEAIEKLNSALRQTNSRQQVLEILIGHSLQSMQADIAGIYQIQSGTLVFSMARNHTVDPPKLLSESSDPEFYQLLHTNVTRFFVLSEIEDKGCTICQFIEEQSMQCLLVTPLRTKNTLVGVMYLGYKTQVEFSQDAEQMINSFTESANNTLQRIQVMEQLEQNIFHRNRELSLLYDITATASETDHLDWLLQTSLEKILKTVNCQAGLIHLLSGTHLTLLAGSALDEKTDLAVLEHSVLRNKSTANLSSQKERYLLRSIPNQDLTWLATPIRVKGVNLGLISLFFKKLQAADLEIIHLVASVADQLGLAVESARQRKQAEESLIIAERQRLARDLHDSVSQSLYGLVLSADVGKKLLKIKEYEGLAETLSEIGRVSLLSLKEMRLMLFELRPLSFEAEGLVGALELRLSAVEKRAGIDTHLDVQGRDFIPPHTELELYRIVTEALNNSLKHANATTISIVIRASEDDIRIQITDNGKGFNTQAVGSGGIGLSSMKERAQRLGGSMNIQSSPNRGTEIAVDILFAGEFVREVSAS